MWCTSWPFTRANDGISSVCYWSCGNANARRFQLSPGTWAAKQKSKRHKNRVLPLQPRTVVISASFLSIMSVAAARFLLHHTGSARTSEFNQVLRGWATDPAGHRQLRLLGGLSCHASRQRPPALHRIALRQHVWGVAHRPPGMYAGCATLHGCLR